MLGRNASGESWIPKFPDTCGHPKRRVELLALLYLSQDSQLVFPGNMKHSIVIYVGIVLSSYLGDFCLKPAL